MLCEPLKLAEPSEYHTSDKHQINFSLHATECNLWTGWEVLWRSYETCIWHNYLERLPLTSSPLHNTVAIFCSSVAVLDGKAPGGQYINYNCW